jgi:NAD(P)-dependent dehydrogenase (short-subunit alcohol dehydrogenase family)
MNNHLAIAPGNVAVITGAASGIGLAAAKKFASVGMKICLADLNEGELEQAEREVALLCTGGASDVLTVSVDVSDFEAMEKLKGQVIKTFGQVNVLMNNAGISVRASTWGDYPQWQSILNVNLWGVINGVQAFTADMIAQGMPACIINTGSKQGITCPPGNTAYNISKAGVKALTEGLQHDLRNTEDCQVSAHLLVPGFTYTGMVKAHILEKPDAAWLPEQLVDYMIDKLGKGDFYIICPDNDVTEETDAKRILWAAGDIANSRPALSRWHPDYQQAFTDFMSEKFE